MPPTITRFRSCASETLTRLYGTEVDVLRLRGRVVVVGTPDDQHVHHVEHGH